MANRAGFAIPTSRLPLVAKVAVSGYDVEVLIDRTKRGTLYRARLSSLPVCGATATSAEEAITRLTSLMPAFFEHFREHGGVVPPRDRIQVTATNVKVNQVGSANSISAAMTFTIKKGSGNNSAFSAQLKVPEPTFA